MDADHKELGRSMVCQECWSKLYEENRMAVDIGSSGAFTPFASRVAKSENFLPFLSLFSF
jgi:hypothetical protein